MSVYENITKNIVKAIESGVDGSDFSMPWHSSTAIPTNVSTGKQYKGMNTLNLWIGVNAKGFQYHEWATFKQWKSLGAKVKRGERGSAIIFWKPIPAKNDEENSRFIMKTSTVFNRSQVENYFPELKSVETIECQEKVERFMSAVPIDLRFGTMGAFYNKTKDFVQLPLFQDFKTSHGYYSTLLHEAAHWTGHETRLDRTFGKRFGDEAYAFEELVAELSAAFLCADLEVSNEPRPNHAQYVAGWLKALKGDSRAIFNAATHAQKAADFLTNFSTLKEKKQKKKEKVRK